MSLATGPSRGRVHRLGDARYGNVYLASDAELAAYLFEYFQPDTSHIATQVDCEPTATQRIALEKEVPHPRDQKSRPWTISTDLVVSRTIEGVVKREAINVKHVSYTPNKRFRALCAVEATYHHERGASWRLCISRGLNTNWARNLLYLYPAADDFYRNGFSEMDAALHAIFLRGLRSPEYANTIRDLCRHLTREFRLEPGAAVRAYRSLLATRRIWTDMNVRDLMEVPPAAVQINGSER